MMGCGKDHYGNYFWFFLIESTTSITWEEEGVSGGRLADA